MTSPKISFYFVLYLVVLVELLAVVIERDNSELELKKRLKEYETIQDSIIASYNEPIRLTVQGATDWLITNPKDSLHILISISNLQTPEEKASVKYFFIENKGLENNPTKYSVISDKKTGNGHFYFKSNKAGTFDFNVFCLIRRKFPSYLPDIILEGITSKMGDEFNAFSDTVNFKVKAKIQAKDFDRPGRG
jgi:hypothetical protein